MSWKNSDLKTSRYRESPSLERKEEGETDPTREKPSPMMYMMDKFPEARETSSRNKKLVD